MAEDARLAPAAGGDPHIGPRSGRAPDGHRQRAHPKALRRVGADEREGRFGQRDDVGGAHDTGDPAGRVQHDTAESVDHFMAGDDGAVVVGDEAGAARASGQIEDMDEGRPGPGIRRVPVAGPGATSRHRRTSRHAP